MWRAGLCFALACGFVLGGTAISCGGSDDASDDGGADGEPREAHVVPYDAGFVDAGGDDSAVGDCFVCGELLGNGLNPNNPPPCAGSTALYATLIDCACNTDKVNGNTGEGLCDLDSGTGDSGTGACTDFCATDNRGLTITNVCLQCVVGDCRLQFLDCFGDGTDAGDE